MKNQCINCKKNYKKLDEKTGLCYYCHLIKFNKVGYSWQPKGKYV